ncbi:uncharacterized protein TrAFT101_001140 [Trichoderma asperellum]|uniref:uncharacterized protein n=1 Tax=Trichoderma asperellum TaxID=101201 RepID=UPI003332B237|nr:hypothetical protein TrAFT101_001140 [Trichoderma asperellum]
MDSKSPRTCCCERLRFNSWQKSPAKEYEGNLSSTALKHGTSKQFTEADAALKHFTEADVAALKYFPGADVVVIYAKGDEVRKCQTCKEAFEDRFDIPSIWWTTLARRSNGYFGYENLLDESGTTRTGTISWVRFLMKRVKSTNSDHNKDDIDYEWVKLNAFVRWCAVERRTEIVLFDHPEFAQKVGDALISQIKFSQLGDPFWVYPIMAQEVAAVQDECVWELRTLIRNYEKHRHLYSDLFDYLHEVSRHSIHINETLHVAESILDSVQKYHDHFTSTELNSQTKDHSDPFSQNVRNRLGHLQTTFTHLRHRSEANHERLKAEISLSFNKSAQAESAATRTISLVGLLLLPAAFIAALFSTSFFNYDAPTGIWGVSGKFWIYWAVTLPVTAITVFLWFFGPRIWNKVTNTLFHFRGKRRLKKENREEEKRRRVLEEKMIKMV